MKRCWAPYCRHKYTVAVTWSMGKPQVGVVMAWMQAAGRQPEKWTGLDWRLCLLVLTLAAGVALCVSHGEAWQLPVQVQARLAQSALCARTRIAQTLILGKLRTWQGSTGRLLHMQRYAHHRILSLLAPAGLQHGGNQHTAVCAVIQLG